MISIAFKNDQTDELPGLPPDIIQSIQELGATCGPMSLAAVFGTSVVEVMRFFPDFPERDHVTWADMRYALTCSGAEAFAVRTPLPSVGVALVQLEGAWTRPGVPMRAQLRYTHWIGCRNGFVFDLNVGDWLETDEWLTRGAWSWLQNVEGCTGFSIRGAYAITPRRFEFSPYGRVPRRSGR